MHEDDPTQPIEPVAAVLPEPAAESGSAPAAQADAGTAAAGAEMPAALAAAPAAVGPAFAAPEEPATAATTPTAAAAPARRPRKRLGLTGQVVGVVGIVVCLVLAAGVLIGRSAAIDGVNSVAATLDADLARGEPLLATASARVSAFDAQLDRLREAAAAVASSDSPAPALVSALSERIGEVSEGYLELRARYGEARERIVSTVERLQLLDRLALGITIPQGPVEALAALDARVQELDTNVMAIIGEGGVVESIQDTAQTVATRVDEADALVAQANELLAEADAKLAETRAKVADLADTVTTVIAIGSIVLVVLLLYIALLHWILFRSASRIRRGDAGA